jgi:hypothetical protein
MPADAVTSANFGSVARLVVGRRIQLKSRSAIAKTIPMRLL